MRLHDAINASRFLTAGLITAEGKYIFANREYGMDKIFLRTPGMMYNPVFEGHTPYMFAVREEDQQKYIDSDDWKPIGGVS